MILQNKNAVIDGAGGSLGGAVAKAFAEAGARVFLTGRGLPSVQKTADEIQFGVTILVPVESNIYRAVDNVFKCAPQ